MPSPGAEKAAGPKPDITALQEKATMLKKACEEALAGGMVFIENLIAATRAIEKLTAGTDFEDVLSIENPPSELTDLMAVLLALCGKQESERDWAAAKLELKTGVKFIEKLKTLKDVIDSNRLPKADIEGVRRYLQRKSEEDLKPNFETLGCFFEFLVNVLGYYDWYQQTKPTIDAFGKARQELALAQAQASEAS